MVINRVGAVVRGNDFYGREALIDLIWQKLRNGNILLAAPRRFGKTSVMYRLIDEPRYGFKVSDVEDFNRLMTNCNSIHILDGPLGVGEGTNPKSRPGASPFSDSSRA